MTFDDRIKVSEGIEKEADRLLETLKTLTPGTKEYKDVHDMAMDLLKVRESEMKLESETDVKQEQLYVESQKNDIESKNKTRELDIRLQEIRQKSEELGCKSKNDKINLGVTIGLGIAGIVAPLVFNGFWNRKGFEFEETGSYTSTTFREQRQRNNKLK